MLAVHWSPVKNTSQILKNGITREKRGLFCMPMTGIPNVDKWWANEFHRGWRPRTNYNGFVFRIVQGDFPVGLCDWCHGTEKPIETIGELGLKYRSLIALRLSQFLTEDFSRQECSTMDLCGFKQLIPPEWGEEADQYAEKLLTEAPRDVVQKLKNDSNFMTYVFENYQLVLSRSIAPQRILRVISAGNESGRTRVRKNKEKHEEE